jgi:hypothetical protein
LHTAQLPVPPAELTRQTHGPMRGLISHRRGQPPCIGHSSIGHTQRDSLHTARHTETPPHTGEPSSATGQQCDSITRSCNSRAARTQSITAAPSAICRHTEVTITSATRHHLAVSTPAASSIRAAEGCKLLEKPRRGWMEVTMQRARGRGCATPGTLREDWSDDRTRAKASPPPSAARPP